MAATNRKRKRILYVEDNEDAREVVALNLAGYKLICARNFKEGARLSRGSSFDLYILDNWLPDGTGVELCLIIREFDQRTPILFYSAAAGEHDIEEGLSAGAQAYLVKPVSFEELEQTVAQLISS